LSEDKHDGIEIVFSLDGHDVISDRIKKQLRETRNFLFIVTPYIGKSFIDILRGYVPRGKEVRLLVKTPEAGDRTFHAIEAFKDVAQKMEWKANVLCNPHLHAKFMIIDGNVVVFGTLNPTSSGIYYNHECLVIFKSPDHTKRFMNNFNRLWMRIENVQWELVAQFHGWKGFNHKSRTRQLVAQAIFRFFDSNGNQPVHKWFLKKEISKLGFNEADVITTIKDLINDGILYEPTHDTVKLAVYNAN
jgi:phosphatidylserine/phosphatidylglycerophosphate/cardiolipin synthase-like enzyme